MKLHEFRARTKLFKIKQRKEFIQVEEFVNTGLWNLPPFGSPPCANEEAVGRARTLSQRFWPKDRHEGCKTADLPLVREETDGGQASSVPDVCETLARVGSLPAPEEQGRASSEANPEEEVGKA